MVDFAMPSVGRSFNGWGPPPDAVAIESERNSQGPSNSILGYCDFVEHLEKFPLTRVGKVCDFSVSGQRFMLERSKGKGGKGDKGKGKGLPPAPAKPNADDEGFSLVDSKPMPGKSAGRGRGGGRPSKGKGKGFQVNYQEGILGQKQKPVFVQPPGQKGKGKKGKGLQRRGMPSFKEWSVQTKTEWEMKREVMLSNLAKLVLDAREVTYEDVMWCGKLNTYNRNYDRVTGKTDRPMRRFEELKFYSVSTSEDPHLQDMLQQDESVQIIATDQVVACLCAAARSVYSWDVVVTKIQGKLIFDKRSGSQIDWLSVNETAQEPPNYDDKEHMNSPVKLSQEASCINQNFSQMILDREVKEMEHPNPFEEEDEDGSVASGAYRYRKITLPGNPKAENEGEKAPLTMIVRTEVNCRMPDASGSKGLVCAKALNEYDPKTQYSWKLHLEGQRGMCLATEVKNNAFKLGRWTAQAILAGCDTMKLGYVSRTEPNNPWSHSVVGVQTHMTDSFADQIGMTRNNMFGIMRGIADLVMEHEDGKYLILKDPTKSCLRLYEVPWDCFNSEDEQEEEEEEEDQELDEDGNVAPVQPE